LIAASFLVLIVEIPQRKNTSLILLCAVLPSHIIVLLLSEPEKLTLHKLYWLTGLYVSILNHETDFLTWGILIGSSMPEIYNTRQLSAKLNKSKIS